MTSLVSGVKLPGSFGAGAARTLRSSASFSSSESAA